MGINTPHDWIIEVAKILNYRIGYVSFNYHGLLIGANSKMKGTWSVSGDKYGEISIV